MTLYVTYRELIAEVQHRIWVHWMTYLFSCCKKNADGSLTISPDKVERWTRQVNTEYIHLSNMEQQSYREQADKVLEIFGANDARDVIKSLDWEL
jgi:hypothetical protein